MDRQLINCLGPFVGPFSFLASELVSHAVHQVSTLIPRQVHTDGAGKGPYLSIYWKASVFLTSEDKPVGVFWISFLLSVNYIHYTETNSALYLFQLQ